MILCSSIIVAKSHIMNFAVLMLFWLENIMFYPTPRPVAMANISIYENVYIYIERPKLIGISFIIVLFILD